MTRHHRWATALCLVLAACGSSKDDKGGGSAASGSASKKDRKNPPHTTNAELVAAPLVAVDSTADGKPFSIELPIGVLQKPEVRGAYSTWRVKQDWLTAPSFTVLSKTIPLREGETGDSKPSGDDAKDRVIARAEVLDDGGFLNLDERTDHSFFSLEVCRAQGTGRLCCTVIQRDEKPIESYAEIVALAEKICTSMKPR